MRIVVAAVGRLKQGPERELAERFRKRAADAGRSAGLNTFDIVEIKESRASDAERRRLEESIAIANVIPDRAVTVIMDERGENVTSSACARRRDLPSHSGPQPGRTSLCESCCWSSSIVP